MLLAGPLADRVFEPAMTASGGSLATVFGPFMGTEAGSGMAVMFVITGFLAALTGLVGYSVRAIRNAEDILPDNDALTATVENTPTK